MGLAIMFAGIGLGMGYFVGLIFLLLGLAYIVVLYGYTIVYYLITGIDPHTGKPPKADRKPS